LPIADGVTVVVKAPTAPGNRPAMPPLIGPTMYFSKRACVIVSAIRVASDPKPSERLFVPLRWWTVSTLR
jgi:hypothetical protein